MVRNSPILLRIANGESSHCGYKMASLDVNVRRRMLMQVFDRLFHAPADTGSYLYRSVGSPPMINIQEVLDRNLRRNTPCNAPSGDGVNPWELK